MNKIKTQPKTIKEKICIFLVLLGTTSIVYFIAMSLTKQREKEIEFINKDFSLTRGIITGKSVHKGRHVTVKYKVGEKYYEDSDGFNENDKVEEGDSVYVKYSKLKPELMITEFNDEYGN